jgi:hypothetical protein
MPHVGEILPERLVVPSVCVGFSGIESAMSLAFDRLTNFLMHRTGIEPNECEVARFELDKLLVSAAASA